MKKKRLQLQGVFAEYCNTYGLINQERKFVDGEYVPAPEDAHFIHYADVRIPGNRCAIAAITNGGGMEILYGYHVIDHIIGYLQGKIDAHNESVIGKTN